MPKVAADEVGEVGSRIGPRRATIPVTSKRSPGCGRPRRRERQREESATSPRRTPPRPEQHAGVGARRGPRGCRSSAVAERALFAGLTAFVAGAPCTSTGRRRMTRFGSHPGEHGRQKGRRGRRAATMSAAATAALTGPPHPHGQDRHPPSVGQPPTVALRDAGARSAAGTIPCAGAGARGRRAAADRDEGSAGASPGARPPAPHEGDRPSGQPLEGSSPRRPSGGSARDHGTGRRARATAGRPHGK
jgi:hypothetical protein